MKRNLSNVTIIFSVVMLVFLVVLINSNSYAAASNTFQIKLFNGISEAPLSNIDVLALEILQDGSEAWRKGM